LGEGLGEGFGEGLGEGVGSGFGEELNEALPLAAALVTSFGTTRTSYVPAGLFRYTDSPLDEPEAELPTSDPEDV